MAFDLVIRGGDVVDGTGLPAFRADVGIAGGRIAAMGRIRERGRREIDAAGLAVTPGFIDGHTHMDAQLHWDPLGTPSCWHGVTSVVMGNCGFTLAPRAPGGEGLLMRCLERAEDISPAAMSAGILWEWETFPQYLDAIERLPKGINYAVHIGHSALRTWAMGERAFEPGARDDDLARMRAQLEAALRAGAIGFSSSRTSNHQMADGRPVASRLASWDEVRALVGAMGALGAGVFEIANESVHRSADRAARREYLDRLKALAVESGAPVTFGVVPVANDNVEAWQDALDLLENTASEGGRMFAQTHSRELSIFLSFKTQLPFDRLPGWRELRALPLADQERQLRDPGTRRRLVEAARHGDYGNAVANEARAPKWDLIRLYDSVFPPFPSLTELAAARGSDPLELFIDLALERHLDRFFIQYSNRAPTDAHTLAAMRHPRAIMTFSDTGAHVGQISDCSIHTHLLAHWVRERGEFGFEEAVRMITLAPARAWGLADRGLLRPGMVADVNVLDSVRIAPLMPEVAHDLPAGARRLVQRCQGLHATVVAGEVVLEDGRHTGALPGRLIRGPLAEKAHAL